MLNWKASEPIIIRVDELGKFVCVAGVSRLEVHEVQRILEAAQKCREKFEVVLQVVDADCIASWRHAISAAVKALRAFNESRNVCDKVEVEVILYLSGRRQIRDAIEAVGVKSSSTRLAVICLAEDAESASSAVNCFRSAIGGVIDNSVLEIKSAEKAEILRGVYDINDDELSAVMRNDVDFGGAIERIVIERGAILDLIK